MLVHALARLFANPGQRLDTLPERHEPRLITYCGDDKAGPATVVDCRPVPALLPPPSRPGPGPRFNLRNISPRHFAEITHELYLEGILSWEEFQQVGFPSELDPRFDETIGALIGEKANPDQPRDMLGQWEERVAFEQRTGNVTDPIGTTRSILDKLCALSPPAI
jgi:hypothetical protein